ncbi:MAG: molybdopterin-dependent oxidoreductase [bacterium]|nr:molybdopterin-dependent oxidoreductase [bacterium]
MPKGEGIGFAGSGFVSGTGSNDIGQGSDTVMVLAAAEELWLNMAEVKTCQSDTTFSPWDSGTCGSRVTFLAGNAARRAAVDCKRKLIANKGNCCSRHRKRDRESHGASLLRTAADAGKTTARLPRETKTGKRGTNERLNNVFSLK